MIGEVYLGICLDPSRQQMASLSRGSKSGTVNLEQYDKPVLQIGQLFLYTIRGDYAKVSRPLKQTTLLGKAHSVSQDGQSAILTGYLDNTMFAVRCDGYSFEEDVVFSVTPYVDGNRMAFKEIDRADRLRRTGRLMHSASEGFYCYLIDDQTGQEVNFRFSSATIEPESRAKMFKGRCVSYVLKFVHPDIIPTQIRVED